MVRVSRGLTLIEILVALGIVVALASLVFPTLSWMSRFRSLEIAREDVEALYLRARAHAAVNGRPIEIHLSGSDLEADWFDARAMFSEDGEPSEGGPSFPMATWSRVRLHDDITYLTGSATSFDEGDANSSFPAFESEKSVFDETETRTTPVLLAILLPDGTAISRERLVLKDEQGRSMDIVVDELTGRITSSEIIAMSSGSAESSDDPFEEPASEPLDSISNQPVEPEPEESS
jgi:prepilin-type N-terminal cleavage/methylation domain-containing protein